MTSICGEIIGINQFVRYDIVVQQKQQILRTWEYQLYTHIYVQGLARVAVLYEKREEHSTIVLLYSNNNNNNNNNNLT